MKCKNCKYYSNKCGGVCKILPDKIVDRDGNTCDMFKDRGY